MELRDIVGLGDKRIAALASANIFTCMDLLGVLPSKYFDFSEVSAYDRDISENKYFAGRIVSKPKAVFVRKLSYVIAKVRCKISGKIFSAVWYNQSFIKNIIKEESDFFFFGKPNKKGQLVVLFYREVAFEDDSMIVPVYRKICGIGTKLFSGFIKQILNGMEIVSHVESDGMTLAEAFLILHFPKDSLLIDAARRRVAFEDLILLASLQSKIENKKIVKSQQYDFSFKEEFLKICSFSLTPDQISANEDVLNDLLKKSPMNRLILGDVGSGKTMVALFACFIAIKSGHQAILMAPTEILAQQHFSTAKSLFDGQDIDICLLTSAIPIREKRKILEGIRKGNIGLIIGTHSVFSEDVIFSDLSLVITDEQHRFGVSERAKLSGKSNHPDTLIMSATPIPRSLALVFYGGLSVSRILSRPMGESRIKTNILSYAKYPELVNFLRKKIVEHSKCFVVLPRIDEDDDCKVESIESVQAQFSKDDFFSDKIGILHGRQTDEKKNEIISDFKNGKIGILISTTVVEVGVDIPDADIIIIHNADRFGLATLHQLRGRVGRRGQEGFCFCITHSTSKLALDRLRIFKKINDGFRLAEEDFRLRGAGTILGTKQHGVSEIFSSSFFSLEEFEKSKISFEKLSPDKKESVFMEAKKKFGDILNKVVLN